MHRALMAVVVTFLAIGSAQAQYMGNYSANPFLRPAPLQPPGTFNNPYGSSLNSPNLYNGQGQYRGNMNANPYDPNSVANPYGRYGSPYSPDSTNNPYGAGSRYRQDSPGNPYGTGMGIYR
jgi:hypothetical protein